MSDVTALARALAPLDADLGTIFGPRLRAVLAYGPRVVEAKAQAGGGHAFDASLPVHTLALVDRVRFEDLAACASRAGRWHTQGFAAPLLLGEAEFTRSLDAFPLEYGEIIAHHVVVSGNNPFAEARVKTDDVRRACEVQAKSLLLHLREAYLECQGRAEAVAQVVAASAAPLEALLRHVARLHGQADLRDVDVARHASGILNVPADLLLRVMTLVRPEDLPPADVARVFPAYLDAVERLASYLDRWAA